VCFHFSALPSKVSCSFIFASLVAFLMVSPLILLAYSSATTEYASGTLESPEALLQYYGT